MNELRLEKHFLEDISRKKIAYSRGTSEFDNKFIDKLPNQLYVNLQHEAGLAEMYRSDGQLLKYAVHIFRQIEGVFNDLFEVDTIHLGGEEINYKYKVLKKVLQSIDESKITYWKYEFFSKVEGLECLVLPDRSKRIFQVNQRIGQNYSSSWKESDKEIIAKTQSKKYKCSNDSAKVRVDKHEVQGKDDALETLKKIANGNTSAHLNAGQQEKIFKWALYFNGHSKNGLSNSAKALNPKPQLNAYLSIKHYRDIAQHNIPGKRSVEQSFSSIEKSEWSREDRMYHKDPMALLRDESTYYQRYVDAIIYLYSELLEKVS